MNVIPGTGPRLLPYGGDQGLWQEQTEQAVRLRAAAAGGRHGAGFEAGNLPVQSLERTPWGWIRWGSPVQDDELRFEEAFPAEVGVLCPARPTGLRAVLARAAWGRRPGPLVRQIGATELPAPISLGRLAVVVAAVLVLSPTLGAVAPGVYALLAAGGIGVTVAWGGPAVSAALTGSLVRVLPAHAPHARLVHRMLGAQQQIALAAEAAGSAELRHAAVLAHRFLWDATGLVLAGGQDNEPMAVPLLPAQLRAVAAGRRDSIRRAGQARQGHPQGAWRAGRRSWCRLRCVRRPPVPAVDRQGCPGRAPRRGGSRSGRGSGRHAVRPRRALGRGCRQRHRRTGADGPGGASRC